MAAVSARTTQAALLSGQVTPAATRTTQAALLVAHAPPGAKKAQFSQAVILAATQAEGANVAKTTQVTVLVAYREGVPGVIRSRAWTFDFDGHSFYVLNLGEEGTWVYNPTTGEWAEFETNGYGMWNMVRGTNWNGRVVAGDVLYPFVWELDPSKVVDEDWRPVEHVATGGIPSRTRTASLQDSLRVSASVGLVGEDGATMRLRFSDDNGQTWSDYYDITLVAADYDQEIAWRSLGSIRAPGRVFEISDVGGLIRIDGCDADIDGVDSDA